MLSVTSRMLIELIIYVVLSLCYFVTKRGSSIFCDMWIWIIFVMDVYDILIYLVIFGFNGVDILLLLFNDYFSS